MVGRGGGREVGMWATWWTHGSFVVSFDMCGSLQRSESSEGRVSRVDKRERRHTIEWAKA